MADAVSVSQQLLLHVYTRTVPNSTGRSAGEHQVNSTWLYQWKHEPLDVVQVV